MRSLIRRMIAIREYIAMAFFKRELGPVERFESALIDKRAARQKLAGRLSIAETALGEVRAAAERLAVAGAPDAQLVRAEANMRAVEGAPRHCTPHWQNSTSRSPQPSAHWLTQKRSASAT